MHTYIHSYHYNHYVAYHALPESPWISLNLLESPWISSNLPEASWIFLNLLESSWISLNLHESPRISLNLRESSWIYLNLNESPWISSLFSLLSSLFSLPLPLFLLSSNLLQGKQYICKFVGEVCVWKSKLKKTQELEHLLQQFRLRCWKHITDKWHHFQFSD